MGKYLKEHELKDFDVLEEKEVKIKEQKKRRSSFRKERNKGRKR
jgi:hypothetical protein